MTTTKSFFSLFNNSLIRIKGISIIFALITFIIFPLQGYFEMLKYANNTNFSNYNYQLPTITLIFLPVMLSLFAILLPLFSLSFMHKKEASILFHSLPVSRAKILLANFLSTVSVYVSVVLLSNLAYMLINIYAYGEEKLIQQQSMLISTLCSGFLIIAITFLCSALASTSFDAFFFTGFICFVSILVYALHEYLMTDYVSGYVIEYNVFFVCSSPIINIYNTILGVEAVGIYNSGMIENSGFIASLVYIPVAIFVFALSCFVYKKRKTEFAQNSSIGSILYKIVIIISVLCFTIIAVMISGQLNEYFFISCIFYSVAIGLCLCAIMRRNFKPSKNVYIIIAISTLISLAYLSAMVYTSWFGSDKYVPNTSEVASVTISGKYFSQDIYYGNEYGDLTFKDDENIEKAKEIHKLALDKYSDYVSADSYTGNSSLYTKISYTLNSGAVVTRGYTIDVTAEFSEMMTELYASSENMNNCYEVAETNLNDVNKISMTTALAEHYTISQNEEIVNKIKDAVLLDIKENTVDNYYSQGNDVYCSLVFEPTYTTEKGISYLGDFSYSVTQNSLNTIKVLKELGYEEFAQRASMEDKQIFKLDIVPNPDYNYSIGLTSLNSSNWYYVESICDYTSIEVIDDESEINELLDKAQIYTKETKNLSVILVVSDEMAQSQSLEEITYYSDNIYSYFIEE